MSKWLPVFLCCFAANAFASTADSGGCPWKMPFTIGIHAVGTVHQYEDSVYKFFLYKTDDGTRDTTEDFVFTIDTLMFSHKNIQYSYSLNADILRLNTYQDANVYPGPGSSSLLIAFAHDKDSILTLIYDESDTASGNGQEGIWQYHFQISSLSFDVTSIFATDSSYSAHEILITSSFEDLWPIAQDLSVSYHSDFTASSVDLSGIFRPTHFADPSSIVEEVPPPTEALSITSMNGSLYCSFGASEQERILEIYSLLGIRVAQYSISPGQTEAIIPRVAPGFYFVRLGNTLTKILVAE